MNADIQHAFERLRVRFDSHSAAARAIGISEDHYCALRNGRAKMTQRTATLILLMARDGGDAEQSIPTTPTAQEAQVAI